MRPLLETLRFFFLSIEFVLLLIALLVELRYSSDIQSLIASVKFSDNPLEVIIGIPSALCIWSFISGRKLLFPEKDKFNIFQEWEDFWKLKAGFHAALAWNVIFATISLITGVIGDWKQPSSTVFISLVVSIIGAAVCSLSVYNAQITVEETVTKYKTA